MEQESENSTYILIDYDNFIPSGFEKDRQRQRLEGVIEDLCQEIFTKSSNTENIIIRLYGGWFKENILSQKGSIVSEIINEINIFPIYIAKRIIRGRIELASSIISLPNYIFGDTLREKKGIASLRVLRDDSTTNCEANKDSCPARILNKFTKSKSKTCWIGSCTHNNQSVFVGLEQKMVDTMIACDFITLCNKNYTVGVYLLSSDVDHLPSIFSGAINSQGKQLKLLVDSAKTSAFTSHLNLLQNLNVDFAPWT